MRNNQQGCYSRKEQKKKINWIQTEKLKYAVQINRLFIVALAFVYIVPNLIVEFAISVASLSSV